MKTKTTIGKPLPLLAACLSVMAAPLAVADGLKAPEGFKPEFSWGVDTYLHAFGVDNDVTGNDNGFVTNVLLTGKLKMFDNWAFNAGVRGYYQAKGDRRHSGAAGDNYTDDNNVDSFSLDTAFLQYANDGWDVRFGRQRADWAYNFNIGNDRRDRFMVSKMIPLEGEGNYILPLLVADLRFAKREIDAGRYPLIDDNDFYDDVHMYAIGAVGNYNTFEWGALYAYFGGGDNNIGCVVTDPLADPIVCNNLATSTHDDITFGELLDLLAGNAELSLPQVGYGIDYFHIVQPYFTWTLDNLRLRGALNAIWSDSQDENGYYTTWGNDSLAGYLEASYTFSDMFKAEVQGGWYADGGLVGRAWDSYSVIINNSDRNDPSPVSTTFFGGLGHDDNDGQLYAGRVVITPSERWEITAGGGHMNIDNVQGTGTDSEGAFGDLRIKYRWSEFTDFRLAVGTSGGDIDDNVIMGTLHFQYK
jgi:hypothetical protein